MNKKSIIIWGILLLLFGLVAYLVNGNYLESFDTMVYELIISLKTDGLTSFMKLYTELGGPIVLILFTLVLCIIFSKNKYLYLIPLNLVLVYGLNFLMKLLMGRERPLDINLIEETGYSFPSGHSMVSLAFYGYLAYLLSKRLDKKYMPLIWIASSLLIFFIGISRIYLGVHFATDIIGGFLLAVVYLIIYINVTEKS